MPKVFISAGHGGVDSGAIGNGFKEKDLNLTIALACAGALSSCGVGVRMSRQGDENDPITDEARECNAYAPDLAISIHNNAGGGDGAEAWYSIYGGIGKTLAENVMNAIVKIGQNSRGVKCKKGKDGQDYYGFIRRTLAPSVIVECAFIDNSNDITIINTEEKCKVMGVAIAKGILATLNCDKEPIQPVTPNPTKSVDEIALEVIAGKWGNGEERKKKLILAGYDYNAVQRTVNYIDTQRKAPAPKPIRKSNEEVATEIYKGIGGWGNGAVRKRKLAEQGYDYKTVQSIVNRMCKKRG